MSTVADVAESLKETLNQAPGGTFSIEFESERRYIPAVDLKTIGARLSVIIVARSDARELLDRGGRQLHEIVVDVGIQKKLAGGVDPESSAANGEIDALLSLAEEIADYLGPTTIIGNAVILRTAVDPIFAPEHLLAHSVFTSVVTVTLKLV